MVPVLKRRFFVFTLILMAAAFSFPAFSQEDSLPASPVVEEEPVTDADCLMCHDQISEDTWTASVHGSVIGCLDCHTTASLDHPEDLPKVDCAQCHEEEVQQFNTSVHGMALTAGKEPAPSCISCHGSPHEMTAMSEGASLMSHANIAETCGSCHETQAHGDMASSSHPLESYKKSVHGKSLTGKAAVCSDCHGSHAILRAGNPESTLFQANVPETCGKCHADIQKEYETSIHGKAMLSGVRESPVCTDCHGEHNILSATDKDSTVHGSNIAAKTCGHCHGAERLASKYRMSLNVVDTYLDSYHGLAGQFGSATVANCSSCHGVHNILPSSDPASRIHPDNLPTTCGQCHPGAGAQLASAKIHTYSSIEGDKVVYYVSLFYLILILSVVAFMIFHNLADFLSKYREHCKEKAKHAVGVRFTKGERIQHNLLTILFLILVYTGFALKYPSAWWAAPFSMIQVGFDWRGLVHKTAGFTFSILIVYHSILLLGTARGRKQLKAFLFEMKDLKDFFQVMRHNLGAGGERPKFKRYNYTEKIEYWALMWGAVIMVLTGLMLTFDNYFLSFLPKWALDTATAIHFYEAVLASLAILIWHFYFVFFDPDHYPMNLSMSSGNITDEEKREEDDLTLPLPDDGDKNDDPDKQ